MTTYLTLILALTALKLIQINFNCYQWLKLEMELAPHISMRDQHVYKKSRPISRIQEDFPAKSLAELMQLVHEDESNRPRSVWQAS